MFRHLLSTYLESILAACALFPVIAGVFTLPFVVVQYRRYGGIAVMRVMVVYSFVLYCMCAFMLTVLPLPDPEAVAVMTRRKPNLIPGYNLWKTLRRSGLLEDLPRSLLSAGAWKRALLSRDVFYLLANVALTVPLGFYLRYYFRLDLKKTVLAGLAVSLFFELTQYSALYGIYPQPYRCADVDDLITNTLGAAVGYAVTPLLSRFLVSREEMDRISLEKGKEVTFTRRLFAAVLDVLFLYGGVGGALAVLASRTGIPLTYTGLAVGLLYLGVLPALWKGRTPGLALVKLRVTAQDGVTDASFARLLLRNVLLYGVEMLVLFFSGVALAGVLAVLLRSRSNLGPVEFLVVCAGLAAPVAAFAWVVHSQRRWNALPHSHLSRTVVADARRGRERTENREDR